MTNTTRTAAYAAIFAADAGTDALYRDRDTTDVADLCVAVAEEATSRKAAADAEGCDFYPVAFVEQAAAALRANPEATIEQLFAAGQAECDSLARR